MNYTCIQKWEWTIDGCSDRKGLVFYMSLKGSI